MERGRYGERRAAFPSLSSSLPAEVLAVLGRGENRFLSTFRYFYRRGLVVTYSVNTRRARYMRIYHFPALSLNRLLHESVSGYYLRHIRFPNSDRPFTRLDLDAMPWPELQSLILSHRRHRYTGYEAALAAGGDRGQLHREIHAGAFRTFP